MTAPMSFHQSVVATSEALHERVRAFARGERADAFETLALDIAHFQAEFSPGFARLVAARGSGLDSVHAIPAVPVTAFRLSRVAVHAPEDDAVRFVTSGTTGSARGVHALRTTTTYAELALVAGARALLGLRSERRVVVALAPVPDEPATSSLGFMMRLFQEAWDGRGFAGRPFDARGGERWLVRGGAVDLAGLERAAVEARSRSEPLLVLATAFALVALLDVLAARRVASPPGTVVMLTGGFKGRSREVEAGALRRELARAFGVPEAHVVGEYGMTELASQLYEGTLPGAELSGEPGVFLEPPWLRVEPVDPLTLEPVPAGELGIARFVDLGNVDSAVAVQTDDLVRRVGAGIELHGRRAGAEPRGCSLALEALIG